MSADDPPSGGELVGPEPQDRDDDPPSTLEPVVREAVHQEIVSIAASFKGPLPPPAALMGYERVLPGCADRIVTMAEQQSAHRMTMERRMLSSDIATRARGQWFALIIVLAGVAGGVFLLANGKSVTGLATLLGPLVLVAGAFIGRHVLGNDEEANREKDAMEGGGDEGGKAEDGDDRAT